MNKIKLFNTHINELMGDDIYIKLNDQKYLFAGQWEPLALEDEEPPGFTPIEKLERRKVHIKKEADGAFKRMPELDGYEFEIPIKYHSSIIKKVFE